MLSFYSVLQKLAILTTQKSVMPIFYNLGPLRIARKGVVADEAGIYPMFHLNGVSDDGMNAILLVFCSLDFLSAKRSELVLQRLSMERRNIEILFLRRLKFLLPLLRCARI